MFKLKNYLWAFVVATGIVIIISANVCKKSSASNNYEHSRASAASLLPEKDKNNVVILTDQTFDTQTKRGIVLVDFWATWCRPCRMQGPILEEVGSEMKGKVTIAKLDVDQNPKTSSKYFIQSIPTIILFKDGKVVKTFIGLTQKEMILEGIKNSIK